MKVIFVVDTYYQFGGTAEAISNLIKDNVNLTNPVVFCRKIVPEMHALEYLSIKDPKEIIDYYVENKYQIIHWFKSSDTKIFEQLCSLLNEKNLFVPIVTTICQKPTSPELYLKPCEIIYTSRFVLIDYTSFTNRSYRFISKKRKSMIYFGMRRFDELVSEIRTENITKKNSDIIYGRGSSFNKCPESMIDNFDKIEIKNKKFIVVGVDEGTNWLNNEVSKRSKSDINLFPLIPFEKWIQILKSFDVFFYQLPLDAYSSIDGTMQQAMLLRKPIVYYGPEAPKVLIDHGITGFIAENEDEFIHYAEILGRNSELRKEMGDKAYLKINNEFSCEKTLDLYNELYNSVLIETKERNRYYRYPNRQKISEMINIIVKYLKTKIKKLLK